MVVVGADGDRDELIVVVGAVHDVDGLDFAQVAGPGAGVDSAGIWTWTTSGGCGRRPVVHTPSTCPLSDVHVRSVLVHMNPQVAVDDLKHHRDTGADRVLDAEVLHRICPQRWTVFPE
ncbi:MAG: hypothetical protein ACRCXL_02425, partial [Dermatophilaceae bacterium]